MAHPGMKNGDDYVVAPYLESWQPIESRRWAMAYINEDQSERYPEFTVEFQRRHPHLFQNQIPTFLPASVDDYVRVDDTNSRQDVDYELANIPMTPKERAAQQEAVESANYEKRMAALQKRGLKPLDQRKPKTKEPSP